MKHLSGEAQRLIARTRGLDEPTLDDRDRIRTRLDASWAASPDAGATHLGSKLWFSGTSIIALAGIGVWLASSAVQPIPVETALRSNTPTALLPTQTQAPELAPLKAQEPASAVAPTNNQQAARATTREAPLAAAPKRTSSKTRRADLQAARVPTAPSLHDTSPQPVAAELLTDAPPYSSQVAPAQTRASSRSKATVETAKAPTRALDERPETFAPDAIADEVSLLGAAQKELLAGQPTRALNYIRQHAFRFPTGALSQERAAVHALALCALNRKSAARVVFDDLQRRAPSAAVLARIRHDCEL